MASMKKRDLEAMLEGKLRFVPKEGNKHLKWELWCGRRFVLRTIVSRSGSDLDNKLVGFTAKNIRLTPKQLRDAVQCTFTLVDYLDALVASKEIFANERSILLRG